MTLALLTSRAVRVKLADIDSAPKVKRELITPILLRRLGEALEPSACDALIQRAVNNPRPAAMTELGNRAGKKGRTAVKAPKATVKASLSDVMAWNLREIRNAAAVHQAAAVAPIEEEDEEEEDEEESLGDDNMSASTPSPDGGSPVPYAGSLPMASATDRVRCPPPGLFDDSTGPTIKLPDGKTVETDSEGDVEENEEDEEESTDEDESTESKASTDISSIGDDSMRGEE